MAEATITDLILTVREENAKNRDETQKNTSQIITLNKTFSDYFTMLKRQSLDAEEARRDTKAASGAGAGATAAITPPDKEGGGFLGILATILVVGGALVVGFVEGFINAARDTFKALRILTGKLFRPIIRMLRLDKFVMLLRTRFAGFLGLGIDGKPTVTTNKLIKGILNPARGFAYLTEGLRSFLGGVGRQLTRLGNLTRFLGKELLIPFKAVNAVAQFVVKTAKGALIPLRLAFTGLDTFFKDIAFLGNKLRGVTKSVDGVPKTAGLISRFFTSLGQTFRAIIKPLTGVFNVFRTIGRVIFFPLTIIMGIFDGIKGAMAGAQEEGILGGILGAVGGIFGGLIGMPLDLLKSAVAWIAGKMGFENVEETLKSFSFKDMFLNLFIGIAGMINTFVDNITSSFQDGIGSGLTMVLTYLKRMLLFPAAVAAGGVAALAAALPGGKSPSEAFSDAFNATFKLGEGSVLPSPSSNTSGSEISSQANDNAATQNGFLAGQSSTQVIDTSQQNNVNISQTQDVAATDDTDKKPN